MSSIEPESPRSRAAMPDEGNRNPKVSGRNADDVLDSRRDLEATRSSVHDRGHSKRRSKSGSMNHKRNNSSSRRKASRHSPKRSASRRSSFTKSQRTDVAVSNPSTDMLGVSWHCSSPSSASSRNVGAGYLDSKSRAKLSRRSKRSRKPSATEDDLVFSSSKHAIRSPEQLHRCTKTEAKTPRKSKSASNQSGNFSSPSEACKTPRRSKSTKNQSSNLLSPSQHSKTPRRSKSSKNPSSNLLSPSQQSKGSVDTRRTTEILYGDSIAKAEKRSSRSQRASKPGFELTSPAGHSHSSFGTGNSSTQLLYGDAKVKAKVSGALFVTSMRSSSSRSTVTDTLYGDDDAKTKEKALRGLSVSSMRSNSTKSTLTDTLYGDDDVKLKVKATHSSRNHNHHPGVDCVQETESSESHASSSTSYADTASMEGSIVTGIMIEESSDSILPSHAVKHTPDAKAAAPRKNRKSKRKQQQQTSYTKYIIAAVAILLVGVGVTAFIALSRGGDDNQGALDPITLSSSPSVNSPNPSSSSPTEAPTSKNILNPPSPEECAAIRKNQTIPGQDSVPQHNVNVNVQIKVKGDAEMTDEMVQDLIDAIEELLIPSLVGCNNTNDNGQRKLEKDDMIAAKNTRKLEVVLDESRSPILYAFVKGQVQEDAVCTETFSKEPCYVVLVEFTLYVGGDITSSELEGVLYDELESGTNIASKLNLEGTFLSVNATNINHVTSLNIPSLSPMDIPSGSPSSSPSNTPSTSLLNVSPSPVPTDVPSTPPSRQPSLTPSSPKSSSPTRPPVVGPSPPPTIAPTFSPSSIPSFKPSTAPSLRPTAIPSQLPTNVPSQGPTFVASGSPSATPSTAPTTFAPSSAPSSKPSTLPSDPPSKSPSPSTTPSVQPSFGTYYWVACGSLHFESQCHKIPPSLQNAKYETMDGIPSQLSKDEIAVRCCSEAQLNGFSKPLHDFCPFAESEVGGTCYNTASYYEAELLCTSVGARLCTLEEVQDGCTENTGCEHNHRMTWTSTPAT